MWLKEQIPERTTHETQGNAVQGARLGVQYKEMRIQVKEL
jgi:hypothetical protein